MGRKDHSPENDFLAAYDEYAGKLLRHIYFKVDSKNTAEDLTSEVFMKTWQYISQGNEIKNIKSFLYRVSNNLVVDYYRGKRETLSLDTIAEMPIPEDTTSLEETWDAKVYFEKAKRHLDNLPSDYKDILLYRYMDELSIMEIKELTGKSIVNIYTIIHRAKNMLKKTIEHE